MNVTAQKFQSLYALVCKSLAWRNHRTTLPQSRPLGVPAPSEREPGGWAVPFNGVLAKIPGCGRFSSPLRNSKDLTSYHSIGCSLKSGVAGDFHRPYGSSVFYISPFGAPTKKAAGYSAAFWEVITLQRLLRAGWGQGWRWHACKSSAAAPPSPEPPQSCQTR